MIEDILNDPNLDYVEDKCEEIKMDYLSFRQYLVILLRIIVSRFHLYLEYFGKQSRFPFDPFNLYYKLLIRTPDHDLRYEMIKLLSQMVTNSQQYSPVQGRMSYLKCKLEMILNEPKICQKILERLIDEKSVLAFTDFFIKLFKYSYSKVIGCCCLILVDACRRISSG